MKQEKKDRHTCNLSNKDFIMKKYPRGNPSHCIQSIQKLSGYNLNESGMYCQTCDFLFNSEQDLELHRNDCKLAKESGEIPIDNELKSNDFDNEKMAKSSISKLEPMLVSKKAPAQSQDKKPSESKEMHCKYCPRWFTEQTNLNRHVSHVHRNVGPFSCESCKKTFASKQEIIRHAEAEKGCSTRKFEQFPDSQGAMTHLATKPVLTKSVETPILEPAVIPIPIQNIQQNENEQTITNYGCSDCGAKFCDKEKVSEHFSKVHKKNVVFLDKKETEDLAGPSQASQQNNMLAVCEKCDLPILNENLDFHKNTCDGPKDYGFESSARNLIDEHYSRFPPQYPDKLGCGECSHKFTQKRNLDRHISTVHYNFKMYSCLKCPKLFNSKQILERHY